MKVLAIGDPHGNLEKVKDIPIENIDLILLTGDLGSADLMRKMAFSNIERVKNGLEKKEFSAYQRKRAYMEAYNSTIKIVKYLTNIAPVYTIYGNVESSNSETKSLSKKIGLELPYLTNDLNHLKNTKIINNKKVNFNGVKIGGLQYFIDKSWVQEFKPSDYKKRLIEATKDTEKSKEVLRRFGNDLDILVCHQPPYSILDKVTAEFAPKHWQGKHAGSKLILNYIERENPKYVFCGHIHEGKGMKKIGSTEVYNLGVCGYKIIKL